MQLSKLYKTLAFLMVCSAAFCVDSRYGSQGSPQQLPAKTMQGINFGLGPAFNSSRMDFRGFTFGSAAFNHFPSTATA